MADRDRPSHSSHRHSSPPRDAPTSSQHHASSRGGLNFLSSIMSTLRRSHPRQETPPPPPEDLGLKTLRQVYGLYRAIDNPIEKEKQLYKILPLFCKNCSKYSGHELVSKFPEAFDFAEGVSLLFVRHVTQLAQGSNSVRSGTSLLKYFEPSEDPETGSISGTGFTILKAIHILANGTEALVTSMTSCNLCSVLVRCLDLFRSLPAPADSRSRSGSLSRTSTPSSIGAIDQQRTDSPSPELTERSTLEKLFRSVLNRLLRNPSAVEDLVKCSDISLLFGGVSSPCAPHNRMWRKAAADSLITICRYSLSADVISFIHKNGCVMFSIKNIERCIEYQPALEVVEMFSTLFCCLKDSADFSQVLLDDFTSGRGYKLLYDYLLRLDRSDSEESRAAIKNLVLLLQDLVFAGFLSLEPTISDGGPFQDHTFSIPIPTGAGTSVRNSEVFQVLQDSFLNSQSSTLGLAILDALDYIFRTDPANYFIVQENHTLSLFLEKLVEKNTDVQVQVFVLLEYVMMQLNYVPTAELTSIGLLLTMDDHPKTLTLALNFLLKLISYDAKFKDVFLEVGILIMLLNALKVYASKLRQLEDTDGPATPSSLSSPSLPLGDLHGDQEEYTFLLMECIRATVEGSIQNGQVFREYGGTSCALQMINYYKPRRMALRLLTQLILLEDGSVDFNALLDQLNQSSQTAVTVKAEILQTVLGVFQLDSTKKSVFREVSGFYYLISVLASLIGSLSPLRSSPWVEVPRSDILKLVQLVFTVLTSAMQDDPANRSFFDNNIRFESFTEPLLLLGCFDLVTKSFEATPPGSLDPSQLSSTGSFTSFEAEFKSWRPPNDNLDEDTFVFSASEVFRFLRDMALDIPASQSTSLLEVHVANLERKRDQNFYRKQTSKMGGANSTHLIHPGAVLCMIDILPAVRVNRQPVKQVEQEDDPQPDVNQEAESVVTETASKAATTDISLESPSSGRKGKTRPLLLPAEKATLGVKGHETEFEDTGELSLSEAEQWCAFLQERVVSEVYSIAISERNQQVLCQVGLPQRIMCKCEAVLADEEHPLHQPLQRTFEKLSYQALTPSDFRNFLRLGNPLCCSLNSISMEELSPEPQQETVQSGSSTTDSQDPSSENKTQSKTDTSLEEKTNTGSETKLGVKPNESDVSLASQDTEVTSRQGDKLESSSQILETSEGEDEILEAPYGGSLSLARIQSLVSMTTPRDGSQPHLKGQVPPFVEFDLSIDGFGCLFFPSLFPQSIDQGSSAHQAPPTAVSSTSGVGGGGDRPFPPNSGLTFSTWIQITRCLVDSAQKIGLLTITQTFFKQDKQLSHYPCLRVYLRLSEKTLVVSTQFPTERRDSTFSDAVDHKDKAEEAVFSCPVLFQLQCWNHVVVVMNKDSVLRDKVLRGKPKVTLFVNGQLVGTKKMTSIHLLHPIHYTSFQPFPSETTPYLINAHIGTHVTQRHVSQLVYQMGPTFLFEEQIEAARTVACMYKLGPGYFGSFQAPVVRDQWSTPLAQSEQISALVPEDKVLFGLMACQRPIIKTIHELEKIYNRADTRTIARELSLSDSDNVTPVALLNNTGSHLYGPSRTLGAIMCGYSGIRSFEPQPLRSLLSSVGGTSVVLGLVAMATTGDSLYASMKALVCIVGNNQSALKEMERTGGFQILGMLLRSKGRMINSNILHLTYTLVGTVNSEYESACIPNPVAFTDLLADLSVWSETSEEVQRSLFNHFFDLLTHSSQRQANAEQMLKMNLVSEMLFQLLDERLTVKAVKAICNVLSSLIGSGPGQEDIRRVGQILATTLPSNKLLNENTIYLYEEDSDSAHPVASPTEHARFGRFHGTEGKQRRAIVLRNILLDVILSLLSSETMELNSRFAQQLCSALGFDWLMLFMGKSIHTETVVRSLRILVQILCDPTLQAKFHEGDIFGSWVIGFETISTEMTQLLSNSLTYFNPLKQAVHLPQIPVPGAVLLSQLLPHHAELSQIYLLMISNLLCRPCSDIPYSAKFNLETLEDLFELGDGGGKSKKKKKKRQMSGDAAQVLLAMSRALLHEDSTISQSQNKAVDLIKYFDRMYRNSPDFRSIASSQEFIDSLASVLFPPITFGGVGKSESETGEGEGDREWIMIESEQLPGGATGSQDIKEPIITQVNNLAVRAVIKLLRTISIDGFSNTIPPSKDSPPSCPILERVLSATPAGLGIDMIKTYQTLVLQSIVEYLHTGNEDVMVTFKGGCYSGSMQDAVSGLSVFCGRLVDKVWQDYYLKPASTVYVFLLSMVEQARRFPKELPLGDLQRSLNRLILHQVSTIPATETEQKALMDTLCLFSSQAHVIFDDTNVDTEFLECLTYCLLKIAFTDHQQSQDKGGASADSGDEVWGSRLPSGYVPGSIAMMKSGANRVWSKMLEFKRKELELILSVELPVPTKTTSRDPLSSAANTHLYSRLQNCEHFITNSLMKAWENFVSGEKANLTSETSQKELRKTSRLRGASFKVTKKKKALSVNSEQVVHEYIEVLCPLLVLAAQKYFESLLRKHQRNVEYRSRLAISEWSKIEYELTRERGLWGPDNSSPLDKWVLDTVEGPNRMRKRLCRNHRFYDHYPHKSKPTKIVKSKYKRPISYDSELHAKRERLFQRPTILATPTQTVTGFHGGEERTPDQLVPPTGTDDQESTPFLTASPLHTPSSGRHNIFNPPTSDNPVAQTLYKMLEPEDRITFQYSCARLTGLDSRGGVLLLGTTHFYVIEGVTISNHGDLVDMETAPDESYQPVVPSHLDNMSTSTRSTEKGLPIECIKWNYNSIREVHKRRYLLRHCAFEIFNSDGQNHFLIFHSKQRDKVYQKLLSLAKSSLTDHTKKYVAGQHSEADPEQTSGLLSFLTGGSRTLPDRWANGEISNFEYLIHLNTLAGRSYNDLMQYPIFPWVLADYNSETLDLTNPETFRDFSKPMGAQTESRLKRFIERYRFFEDPTGENTPPYYYGTHYSSAMIVASFLIRLEPFTQHFLKLQGGHFDLPDRLFHSIPDAWRSASETNMADIKELIPEFFYLPEFLVNSNRFDLGTKQSGVQLNNVILPPWAKGDPHEFIRVHREALESDYVTAHLHEWIDLIFGYKQTGDEALKAHNVFHHLFYEGAVDIDKIEDPVKRNAAISFIHNFGQTPKQLFKKPHRARKLVPPTTSVSDSPNISTRSLDATKRMFYKNVVQLMPSREPIKEVRGEVTQMVCVSDNKIPIAVDRYKLLLPPNYTHYFIWGFPDFSARTATVETDRVSGVFEGLHEGRILCAAAGDENMILTGGESTVVCVWELTSKQKEKSPIQLHLKHTLHGHTAPVTCVTASTNYNLIISGSKDQSCILWDMNSFSFVRQLTNHSGSVALVTINQLNGNIVSCTKNQVRLWTVNGTLLAENTIPNFGTHRITCCTVSELYEWDKDNVIITGSTDGVVRVWVLEYSSQKDRGSKKRIRSTRSLDTALNNIDSDKDPMPSSRSRGSTVVEKLRVTTLRERSSSSPSPLNTTVLKGREAETFPDFDHTHFADSNSTQTPETASPATVVVYKDQYAHMEASIEDKLDKDDADLLLDLNRDTEVEEEVADTQLEHLDTESHDLETESSDESPESPESPGSPYSDDQPHVNLTQVSNDSIVQLDDENGRSDIVFTDVEEKSSQASASKNTQDDTGSGAKAIEATKSESEVPKGKITYEELMAEQRRKAEELEKKTGTWYRNLTMVHTLTMHTSFNRKDNDTPASVTSLCISKDHRRLYVGDARGRIFSWSVSDNLGSVMEHWLKDESVDNCMRCKIEFGLLERKHHCRDCGKIFCNKCSSFECEVRRLKITKKVRVCADCYRNLSTPSPTKS